MNSTDEATWIHAKEIRSRPAVEIDFLAGDFLPRGAFMDISGPPGEGKSTIALHLLAHVSCGEPWFGFKTKATPVAWVSGELSNDTAFRRDLDRLDAPSEIDLCLVTLPTGHAAKGMFTWSGEGWSTTKIGHQIICHCRHNHIGVIALDTIGSLVSGLREIDNDQQRQLARHIRSETEGLTVISISHTNQASMKDDLSWRLHYLSRAGGNGYPGALRVAAGVSRLQEQDVKKINGRVSVDRVMKSKIIAFGFSKSNEMPTPVASNFTPMIFEITKNGQLVLISSANDENQSAEKNPTVAAISRTLNARIIDDPSKL